jgi:choline-sulfatase
MSIPENRPNILVFMVDQQVPMLTGPYGHKAAHTPHLDRLAAEGIVFENAYSTCPVCVPARYSMLTGKYCATTGCYDNASMLSSEEPTHNHYLNVAGYDTVLSGKAHYIGPDQLHGFRRRLLTNYFPTGLNFLPRREASAHHTDLHPNPIAIDYIGENVGVRQWSMQLEYDENAVQQAINYLATRRSQPSGTAQRPQPPAETAPFFLQISLNHPHEPFHPPQKYWDLYDGVDIEIPEYPDDLESHYTRMDRELIRLHGSEFVNLREPESLRALHRAYLALTSYIDAKLGQILEALETFGLAENTVVLFLSDHGDMLGHRGMVQKRCFYEYSSRIPLIARFPQSHSMGKAGRRVAAPVSITDFAPTVCELAGVDGWLPMDGRSLLPLMRGEDEPERYVFCENYAEGVTTPCFMVRRGRYKYTLIHEAERQLFDLEKDPDEWHNLAGKQDYADIERELEALILKHFDPEAIDAQARESYQRKLLLKQSHELTKTSWDYTPKFDASTAYWR